MPKSKKSRPKFYDSFVSEQPEESEDVGYADTGEAVEYDGDMITIDIGEEGDEVEEPEGDDAFDANLAEKLSDNEQRSLGQKLREYVEIDLQSRADWEQRMQGGLEIIGLKDLPDDAVAFEGAARANYPGISEAMVQFQARAMDELMPAEGPVKTTIIGKKTEELEDRAARVEEFMNYQLMEEDDEYYNETDDMLMYLPYAGSAFKKIAPDPVTGLNRSRFVAATDFIVPSWAKSLHTTPRYTHRYSMAHNVYKRAVDNGYFIDADFPTTEPTDQNVGKELADVSDDRTPTRHTDDHELHFYEMTVDWDFEWETYGEGLKYSLPYAITFEWETGRVVRIARCWQETDEKCTKDVWFVHYKFLPGLGFYGWGYLHLIGGLGRAAGGALRLLLDGSALSSLQGGFKSSDARLAGDVSLSPATWTDVDMTAEELAKSFYTPPYKEPSPALFKTFEILVQNIQRFASTTENMVGDASNKGPVGTTVALIEQGSKILSGIHKRLHAAARREFKLIAAANYRFMEEDTYPFEVAGAPREIFREDFGPEVDVVPVSDPNIFSNVQRIAMAQAVMQMVDTRPDLFPKKAQVKAYRAMLRAMKVPDWEQYLPENDIKRLDPVSENEAMANGHPAQVFREQDDAAHMAVHQNFYQEVMSMPPDVQTKILPVLQAHLTAHFAQAYRKKVEAAVMEQLGVPLPPYDPNGDEEDAIELPADMENAIARAAAQFAPPPPPPPEAADPEAGKDEAMAREQDRKDEAFRRDEARKDEAHKAQMKRDGLVTDVPDSMELSPQ